MKTEVWTWGTGGPFGRELGVLPNRKRRGHAATSIIVPESHFLIDAGAPCTETMIDRGITRVPDALFLTHSHFDHISDLDRLANSRSRGLRLAGKDKTPLPVIGTEDCLFHPEDGAEAKFGYLGKLVKWTPIPSYDTWYSVRRSDGGIIPSGVVSDPGIAFSLEFKALPVYHSAHAPGACMFIFRCGNMRVVTSGDFVSIEESVASKPDLKDPSCLVLDTNTIKATGAYHTNWEQNKKLIRRWTTGDGKTLVLLNHISGFGDWVQGHYDHVPDDEDWRRAVESFDLPKGVFVKVAEDGDCYPQDDDR